MSSPGRAAVPSVAQYIEFFGMPGVGKTTACELLLRAFRMRTVRVESLDQAALGTLLSRRGMLASGWLTRHVPARLRPGALDRKSVV